jgi:hypothetical protein
MKKISLSILLFAYLLIGCLKTESMIKDANLKTENADLVSDWITVQLQVIKNTSGVQHIAYSRHFAYTGIALYEALVKGDNLYKSISGQLNNGFQVPEVPAGKPLYWPAAANAAVAEMLRFFYSAKAANLQSIDSLEHIYINKYINEAGNGKDVPGAIQFGKLLALAVIEWSKQDGSNNAGIPYTPLGEGYWEPTPPGFGPAAVPGWGNNKPIISGSQNNTIPNAPTAFSKDVGSSFYNMARELFDISQSLTEEQKALATFWDDAPNGKYLTVFGHWFSILKQVIVKEKPALMKAAEAYLRLGITMNESSISCWKAKYTYNLLRPVTYIRKYMGYPAWNSFIGTPPHPEYSAAHATLSGSAGYTLESVFGENYRFTDHSYDFLGMAPRTFSSFEAAGKEAGISRLYGGIHYRPSIEAGNIQGKKVGENVRKLLKTKR